MIVSSLPVLFAAPSSVLPVSAISAVLSSPALPFLSTAGYLLSANLFYLARRAHLRQQTMRTMLGYRLDREPGVSVGRYLSFLLAWQCFVVAVFPVLEPLSKFVFQSCCLYYSYPNAHGFGFIVEPLDCQHLPLNKRAKKQLRFDWHRFRVNVGNVGRDGYRHPPTVEMNRPHIDAPKWGIKHWPWRRQHLNGDDQ
jgi:hypothetical protein